MSAHPVVSPFTFLAWKEDDLALVAATVNKEMGYIALMEVDGVDADAIVQYAKDVNGEELWQKDLAKRFPEYIQALASQQGKQCFTTTGKAHVEFSDLNTGEVLSDTFPATEQAYNEAVRVDEARTEHTLNSENNYKKTGGNNEGEDDDEYEDVEEDEEDAKDSPETRAYMRRRQLVDMISTQLETAITLANELGLSAAEVEAAYRAAVGDAHPLPTSMEQCAALASKDRAMTAYMQSAQASGLTDMAHGAPGCHQQ